jgi:hypothetical protein|tara:strand:- start:151 stop:366 length:216 start_codon:yes stop_codon:yes gene_type:complete
MREIRPASGEVMIRMNSEPDTVYICENFDEAFEHLDFCRKFGYQVDFISHEKVRYDHELKLRTMKEEGVTN